MFICAAAQIALLKLTWHLTVHKAKEQQGGRMEWREQKHLRLHYRQNQSAILSSAERWLPDLRLRSNKRVLLHSNRQAGILQLAVRDADRHRRV